MLLKQWAPLFNAATNSNATIVPAVMRWMGENIPGEDLEKRPFREVPIDSLTFIRDTLSKLVIKDHAMGVYHSN
jgi:hypothetical protein